MLLGQKLGPFFIEKELGSGAMGSVFRALYTKTNQRVAIKIISPSLLANESAIARFEREAAILKQLKHRNIVRLYATGRYKGTPFFAMEYIDGESLDRVLARRLRFTWEEVVTLGKQLCDALQHAHQQGIIHRDLKPSNLMILRDGTLKLTDFGIAKDMDVTQLTGTNSTVGTAAYMSPEQCKGEKNLTLKTDLYSMGVMFYELLTGRKPFTANTTMDMFMEHVQGTFQRPNRIVLEIPMWLDTIVCQLLEKKPEHRPLDAAMVGQALDEVLEKVTSQKSAGVEAATGRAVDRPRGADKPTEEDKEAAMTLKQAVTKKKLRRKVRPFYEKLWFQFVAIPPFLALAGAVIWWALQPPSAETLFQRAEKLMNSASVEDHRRAREGPIRDFFRYYPDRADEQAQKLGEWADQVDRTDKEDALYRHLRVNMKFEEEAWLAAYRAVQAERLGDTEDARKEWQTLKESPGIDRIWRLVATKHLQEIDDLSHLEQRITKLAGNANSKEKEAERDGQVANACLEAAQVEASGDLTTARDLWRTIKEKYEDSPKIKDKVNKNRPWVLLAAMKAHELTRRLADKGEAKKPDKGK